MRPRSRKPELARLAEIRWRQDQLAERQAALRAELDPEPEPVLDPDSPEGQFVAIANELADELADHLTRIDTLCHFVSWYRAWGTELENNPDAHVSIPETVDEWLVALTWQRDNPWVPPDHPTAPNLTQWTPEMVETFARNMGRHYTGPDYDDLTDEHDDAIETVYGFTTPLHSPGRGAPPGL